jgi:Ala-tRNA(Pro) deacylase
MRLDDFLTQCQAPYRRLHHEPVYTANRIAQILHVRGKEMAKSVLVRTSSGYVVAVLPANYRIDLEQLCHDLGDVDVELACEDEMEQLFPDCERGAVPPFGSLYHLTTMVDESLAEDKEIVFEGPNHEEAIGMAYQDYAMLEHPRLGHFAFAV